MPAMMDERAPISVVVPTLNAAEGLPMTLAALAPAALGGLVREVVISDGGSTDDVAEIADAAGARFIVGRRGRGVQLAQGAAEARGRWLLFLHADTQLEPGWENDASALIESGEDNVGVFSLRFDEAGVAPALVAGGAMIRTRVFGTPYGDQGLLVSRKLYDAIGGYRDMPLFEDVDIIDRIKRRMGRKSLVVLTSHAVTSAARYRKSGYGGRVVKNALCMAMYRAGVSPEKIAAFYR